MKKIKSITLLLLTVAFLAALPSCWHDESKEKDSTPNIKASSYIGTIGTNRPESQRELYIYKIDGCEYIGNISFSYGDFLTHKGNCSNPIHEKNK